MLCVLVLVHYLLGRKISTKHKSRNVCQQGNSVISMFSVFYDTRKSNAFSFFVKVSNIRLILIFNKPFTSLRSDLWILQNYHISDMFLTRVTFSLLTYQLIGLIL